METKGILNTQLFPKKLYERRRVEWRSIWMATFCSRCGREKRSFSNNQRLFYPPFFCSGFLSGRLLRGKCRSKSKKIAAAKHLWLFQGCFFHFFGKEKRGNRVPSQREGLKDLINEKQKTSRRRTRLIVHFLRGNVHLFVIALAFYRASCLFPATAWRRC